MAEEKTDITKDRIEKGIGELKGLAKTSVANPRPFLILLGVNFLICTIAYYPYMGLAKAILSSILFTLIWGLIFVLIPYILRILIGLIFLAIIILAFIGITKVADPLTAIIVIIVGLVVLAIILGLLIWAIILLPGAMLGVVVYEALGKGSFAGIIAIIVFLITSAIIYFILRYVIPFIIGFTWASVTGLLAHKITSSIFIAQGLLDIGTRYGRHEAVAHQFNSLFNNIYFALKPPGLLSIWIFIISVILGFYVAKGANRQD